MLILILNIRKKIDFKLISVSSFSNGNLCMIKIKIYTHLAMLDI